MGFLQAVKIGNVVTMKQVLIVCMLALGLVPLKAQELKFSAVAQPAKVLCISGTYGAATDDEFAICERTLDHELELYLHHLR